MTRGVLFLCTGNACRSQMAEGIARAMLPGAVQVSSAGTSPKGLDPRAVDVMRELGIDIAAYRSKGLEEVPMAHVSRLVTLCGDAAEHCPALPGVAHEHWPVRDPARAAGSDAQVLDEFRAVRDELWQRVSALAASIRAEHEPFVAEAAERDGVAS